MQLYYVLDYWCIGEISRMQLGAKINCHPQSRLDSPRLLSPVCSVDLIIWELNWLLFTKVPLTIFRPMQRYDMSWFVFSVARVEWWPRYWRSFSTVICSFFLVLSVPVTIQSMSPVQSSPRCLSMMSSFSLNDDGLTAFQTWRLFPSSWFSGFSLLL